MAVKIISSRTPRDLKIKLDGTIYVYGLLYENREGVRCEKFNHKDYDPTDFYSFCFLCGSETIPLSARDFDTLCELEQSAKGIDVGDLKDARFFPSRSVGFAQLRSFEKILIPRGLAVNNEFERRKYFLSDKAKSGIYTARINSD